MEVSSGNISKNIGSIQLSTQPNTGQNKDVQSNNNEIHINNKIYSKFVSANAAMPINFHVRSNFADLRIFSDDRNLYEILLGKDAKEKGGDLHKQALIGTALGTLIPAAFVYANKFKKGKVDFEILKALAEPLSKAKTQAELTDVITKFIIKAKEPDSKFKKIAEKLEKITDPQKQVKKLFKRVGLDNLLKQEEFNNKIAENLSDISIYNKFFKKLGLKSTPTNNGDISGKIEKEFKECLDTCREKYIEYTKKGKKGKSDKNININFLNYFTRKEDLNLLQVLAIGAGSIFGGVAGGVIKDDGKMSKKKIKESNYQLISNLIVPALFSKSIVTAFNLDKLNIDKKHIIKSAFNISKGVAGIFIGVVSGMAVGTLIANGINKLYYKDEKYDRKIEVMDLLIQEDDLATGLNFLKLPFMDKILLPCLAICGYQAGKKE